MTEVAPLTGVQRAAVLLLSLGELDAAEVLRLSESTNTLRVLGGEPGPRATAFLRDWLERIGEGPLGRECRALAGLLEAQRSRRLRRHRFVGFPVCPISFPDRRNFLPCSSELNSLFRQRREICRKPRNSWIYSRVGFARKARRNRITLIIPCIWHNARPNRTASAARGDAGRKRRNQAGKGSSPAKTLAANPRKHARKSGENRETVQRSGWVADREGFEPSRRFPAYTLSRRAPSTTRPSLR